MNPSPIQSLIAQVSKGVGALRAEARTGLRILMYHAIGTPLADERYSIPFEQFECQMRWLCEESGQAIVSLADGVTRLAEPGFRAVAITFDDGYRDTPTVAAPVLVRYGLPFTVFVVGSYLTCPPLPGLYLDRAALRELAAVPGATVGAHGHTHRPLTRLADADLLEELHASAAVIADVLGAPPDATSYPHGAVDARVVRLARAAGFSLGATSLLGMNRAGVSPWRLRRTEIGGEDTIGAFRGKVRGDWDWYQLKQRLYWPVPGA